MTRVKICGLSDEESVRAAVDAGADFIGFVFYPPSPRNIRVTRAAELARLVPKGITTVGLFVNPTDDDLRESLDQLDLGMVQLHGDETPQRVAAIKEAIKPMVNKAIRIESDSDLKRIKEYEQVSDWLLFDSKNPDSNQRGGTGQAFDWNLLKDHQPEKNWMLAGGLDSSSVRSALAILSPTAVDVSSGVEHAPGRKDSSKIREFIAAVKNP
jgi:phosphoribosylanthranilate isomerase